MCKFSAIDWALATDVLPSPTDFARDMGLWNLAFTLPQVLTAPIGAGVDWFRNTNHKQLGWFSIFLISSISLIFGTYLVKNVRHVK